MTLHYREQLILAKTEATAGTAVTLAAADAILCGGVELTPLAGERRERENIQPFLGARKQLWARRHARLRFDVELAGSGAAGTAPAWGMLLEACFMKETIQANTSAAYAPDTPDAPKSLTISCNVAGVRQTLSGCRGTWSLNVQSGEAPMLRFDFVGAYADPVDAAFTSSPDYTDFKEPLPAGTVNTPTASIYGANVTLHGIEIDYGANVSWTDLIGASAGPRLGDRVMTGRLTIDAPKVAALALVKKAADSEAGALSLIHGTAEGGIVAVAAPKLRLDEPSYGESDGVWTVQSGFSLLPTSGNDEITIKNT
ncbi:MAG: phage tail tube protein [Gammaproteobacteria bacterium]|nr:phage tail tube protein [Gammaproteobacteria bacterium]